MNAETAKKIKRLLFALFITCFGIWFGLLLGYHATFWIKSAFGFQRVPAGIEAMYELSEFLKTVSLIMGLIYAVADIFITSFTKEKK